MKGGNFGSKLPATHGCSFVNPSFKKTWRKAPRLVVFDESGAATIYAVDLKKFDVIENKNESIIAELST